uniref:Uncharacterized protein n=1 Tax=Oryza punctata TaxID=4537 RepID=A0A0E0MCG5_ORYPU
MTAQLFSSPCKVGFVGLVGENVLDTTSGECFTREQTAWIVSTARDIVGGKEKLGLRSYAQCIQCCETKNNKWQYSYQVQTAKVTDFYDCDPAILDRPLHHSSFQAKQKRLGVSYQSMITSACCLETLSFCRQPVTSFSPMIPLKLSLSGKQFQHFADNDPNKNIPSYLHEACMHKLVATCDFVQSYDSSDVISQWHAIRLSFADNDPSKDIPSYLQLRRRINMDT